MCQGTVSTGESLESSWDPPGQEGRHWQPIPSYPRSEQCSQRHGTAPAQGITHLSGVGLRLGWDVSPCVLLRIRPSEDKLSQTSSGYASRAMGKRKVHTCQGICGHAPVMQSGICVGNQVQQSPLQISLGVQGWDFSGELKGVVLMLNLVAEGWLAVKNPGSSYIPLQQPKVALETLRPPRYPLPWYWMWNKYNVENKDPPIVVTVSLLAVP